MKIFQKLFIIVFLFSFRASFAQNIDAIYVNLYTDSLKRGTYNYINIDGHLSSGRFLPLDSSQLIFNTSYGKFFGNNLLIDKQCSVDKVKIKVVLRKDPTLFKEFVMYIKKNEDNERLPTSEEILERMKKDAKKKS